MKKIVVIGSLNIDMVVQVDHIVKPGETISTSKSETFYGGKGANQAFAVAIAGGSVAMIGKVGNDSNGEKVISNLENVGVDTSYISKTDETHTGYAFISVDQVAENSIVVVKGGANDYLRPSDIESAKSLIESCDLVLIQQEIPKETIEYAIELSHSLGKYIILNPAPPVISIGGDVLKKVNMLTPNRSELNALFNNCKSKEKGLATLGVADIIVTLGSDGVRHWSNNSVKSYKARQVVPIDTTGAGDCFNGFFWPRHLQKVRL